MESIEGPTSTQLRNALGRFPTGVAIATAQDDGGQRLGLTISSFNSVSLDPPLVLFSIARTAMSFSAWQRVEHFAINVLAEGQEALSTRFAKALADKWDGVPVMRGSNGLPLIPNALVVFECSKFACHEGGDHEIFIGQVDSIRMQGTTDSRPLVFHCGKYRKLDAGQSEASPPSDFLFLHGW